MDHVDEGANRRSIASTVEYFHGGEREYKEIDNILFCDLLNKNITIRLYYQEQFMILSLKNII